MPRFEGDAEVHSLSGQWRATMPLCKEYMGGSHSSILPPHSGHPPPTGHITLCCNGQLVCLCQALSCARHTKTESQAHELKKQTV